MALQANQLFAQLCNCEISLLYSVLLTDVYIGTDGQLSIKQGSLLEMVANNKELLKRLDILKYLAETPATSEKAELARKLCLAIIASNIEHCLLEVLQPADITTHLMPHLTVATRGPVQGIVSHVTAAAAAPKNNVNNPDEPFLFIEPKYNSKGDGTYQFVIPPNAANILAALTKPVVVISVAGKYRTGKSYLMNRLHGKQHGFGLGATVEGCTMGIHAWIKRCPDKPHDIILLDTQGLDDIKRHSALYDVKILVIAMILASYFIFNGTNVIDLEMLNTLDFAVNLTNSCWKRYNAGTGVFAKLFNAFRSKASQESLKWPKFMLLLRDFGLQLPTVNGKLLTPTEYMEQQLAKSGFGSSSKQALFAAFPQPMRCCRTLPRPIIDEQKLRNLERIQFEALNQQFRSESEALVQEITEQAPVFATASGKEWAAFASKFVEFVNNSSAPEIENAFEATCSAHNFNIKQDAILQYKTDMNGVKLPVSEAQLMAHHTAAEQKLHKIVKERAMGGAVDKLLAEINKEISKECSIFSKKNYATSEIACTNLAKELLSKSHTQSVDWLKAEYNKLSAPLGPAAVDIYKKMIDTEGAKNFAAFTSFFTSLTTKLSDMMAKLTQYNERLQKAEQEQITVDAEVKRVTNDLETLRITQETQTQQMRTEIEQIKQKALQNNTDYENRAAALNARLAQAQI